jgi:hypothetical protein
MTAASIRAVVELLRIQDDPRRRAFAELLIDVALAMEAISLVDSGVAAEGTEHAVIDKVLKTEAQLTPVQAAHILRALDRLTVMLLEAEHERMAPIFHQTAEHMGGLIMAIGFRIMRLGGDPAAIRAEWLKEGKDENTSAT